MRQVRGLGEAVSTPDMEKATGGDGRCETAP